MGLAMLLRAAGLWWQVAAMKLMEAAALIGAGLAGRAIANYYSPGRGDLALLAIGLNPLFLIEGPGNGHNDLLMMSLLLVGALLLLRKRFLLGSLVIGLSIGIKFVTLLALAWLLLEYVRGRKAGQKMSLTTAGLVIGVVPIALGYLPFWEGTATLTAPYAYLVWDENGSAGDSHIPFLQSHWQMFVVVLLMVLLTLWLLERKGGSRWPAAWSILTVCASFLVMPMSVPWYFIWPLAVSLTRWDLLHVGISVACLVLAFFSTLLYCLPG
jgi:alpha-1,6-mannosyltransferase